VNTIRGLALDDDAAPRLARGRAATRGRAEAVALAASTLRARDELPIVGMGGVANGRDALELLACGATHVALGTVLFAIPTRPRACAPSCATSSTRAGFETPEAASVRARELLPSGKLTRNAAVAPRERLVDAALMVPPRPRCKPRRSLDQRMEALKRANDIRVKRAS
jgi:hypothetical protein